MKPNDLKIILAFMRAQTLAFGRVLRDVYGIDENESVFILDDFEDFCNFPTAPCGGGDDDQ